ncbi:PTS sugar transporter subunit IIA [Demequina capsici]|uniref:Mannitol-specific phosphotransferase enzyme IIA component n=1 Tax=Demequina capsici TaxID=3075620 RepID=A0AA96JDH8_9MICO|nr:PTS sugar transporter subunit IIA [Demequina sp. PMTSA13]WNM28066.1 PTS sugar transporter subunit IIA [Demequina sp. PMTSA13]
MAILSAEGVRLGLTATDKADALTQCGEALVSIGAATQEYAAALHDRELQVTTYIGEGVAIPHGTNESREHIQRAAIAYLQFPDGVDWDGNDVRVCIAIASRSEEHIEILQRLASVLMDPDAAASLREPASVDDVLALLAGDAS